MPEKIAKFLVEESGKQTTMLLGSQMLQEIIGALERLAIATEGGAEEGTNSFLDL